MKSFLIGNPYTGKEPPLGQGMSYGENHDVVARIHPTDSWWSKYWNEDKKRWVRYKVRFNYCRHCNKWKLGI